MASFARVADIIVHDRKVRGPHGRLLAYGVKGSGPALVLTNGLTTTATFWKYLRPCWARHYSVLTWDLPGHGASEPAPDAAAARIEAQPAMLAAVMDDARIETAVHIGFSVGCQIAFEMFRQYPPRCAALVALLGGSGLVLDTAVFPVHGATVRRLLDHVPEPLFARGVRLFARAAKLPASQAFAKSLGVIGRAALAEDVLEVAAHLGELDPFTVQHMARSAAAHSAHDVLAGLDVPLLVVAGGRDPFAPARTVGGPIHAAVPGSELVEIAEGTHTALLEHPEVVARAVEDFVARRASRA